MQELETVLRDHAARYPRMQPQDAVKLLYQNEFGAAHMIADEDTCRSALREEYARTERSSLVPHYESIGGNMVRVHLASLDEGDLDTLAAAFIDGANCQRGSEEQFREKLALLIKLTQEAVFSFSPEALAVYLAAYEAAGFPAVSHSETYRSAYRPAYRVVPLSG